MNSYVTEVAALLGPHVVVGPVVLWPLLAVVVTYAFVRASGASQNTKRPAPDAHWSEVARWATSARSAAVVTTIVGVVTVGLLSKSCLMGLGWVGGVPTAIACALAFVAGRLAFLHAHPALAPERGRQQRLAWYAVGPGTLYYWAFAPVVWGPFVSNAFDARLALVLTLALVSHFAWGAAAFPLWRATGLLVPAPPGLDARVRALAESRGIRLREVAVLRARGANAFAFPLGPSIVMTERLLEILEPGEQDAVALHELGHLLESRMALAARILYPTLPLALLLVPATVNTASPLGGVAILAFFYLALRLFARFSRHAEAHADAHAAEGDDEDSVAYAHALLEIHRDRLIPAVTGNANAATHPDLYDRLVAVGHRPDFARPEPPRKSRPAGLVVFLTLGFAVGFSAPSILGDASRGRHDLSRSAWLNVPTPTDLLEAAGAESSQGGSDEARRFLRVALAHVAEPELVGDRAYRLIDDGHCDRAAAYTALVRRHDPPPSGEVLASLPSARDFADRCWPPRDDEP